MGGGGKGSAKQEQRTASPQEQALFQQQQGYMDQQAGVAGQQLDRSNAMQNDYNNVYRGMETGLISPNATRETGYMDMSVAGQPRQSQQSQTPLPPKPSGKGAMTQDQTMTAIQESGRDPNKLSGEEYKQILSAQAEDQRVADEYNAAIVTQQAAAEQQVPQQQMIYNRDPNANYRESVIAGNENNTAALNAYAAEMGDGRYDKYHGGKK